MVSVHSTFTNTDHAHYPQYNHSQHHHHHNSSVKRRRKVIKNDPELLTRTSWVDAKIAHAQIKKVSPDFKSFKLSLVCETMVLL